MPRKPRAAVAAPATQADTLPIPGTPRPIPAHIRTAIKSGPIPALRHWRGMDWADLTLGERVCFWVERFVVTPEGVHVGKPMKLSVFQEVFLQALFHAGRPVRRAILSVGRKQGKTALIAALLIAFLFMKGLTVRNSRINSGALSRDQAGLVFRYMSQALRMSADLGPLVRIVESSKLISVAANGCEYKALAADASTAMGLSPLVLVGDEWGQIVGPDDAFINALLTSQGAHAQPMSIIISTQAASDADWLSIQIDDATANPSDDVVCHVYAAPANCALDDRAAWLAANPAMGEFRSIDDIDQQARAAMRMPTSENAFRNLVLNQRIALESAFMAPGPWRECSGKPELDVFLKNPVAIGLDLSARNDLTAAVMAARDSAGVVHLVPFVYCPAHGIEQRALRDRVPYDLWVKQGYVVPLGGRTMDYQQIAEHLQSTVAKMGIDPAYVVFDRWGIRHFQKAAEEANFAQGATWVECGQGFRDMSPRCKAFESLVLAGKVRHGAHPLLNMAFSTAIAQQDPAGNIKLAKNKSTQRIDPAVAAVMAAFQISEGDLVPSFDIRAMMG